MIRRTPLRRKSPKKRKAPRWQCRFCAHLNVSAKKKCGACGKMRNPSAHTWMRNAQDLHVLIVRPPGTPCFNCQGTVGVQDAHIFGRGANRSPAVQWHPFNGIPLCDGVGSNNCHDKFDSYQINREALIMTFLGVDRYAELREAATKRWDRDWPAVIARLRRTLAPTAAAVAHINTVGASLHAEAARPTEDRG